jgi:ubiquinone/menaquinone biosynthesis C-methylase UbiE
VKTTSFDQVPEGWNSVAETYEQSFQLLTAQYAEEALRLTGLGPGERVLDVAAGPGALSIAAANAGADVVAIDFSSEMIRCLRARIANENFAITTHVMDGQHLTFPDEMFDAGYSIFGLMFFPDRARGFDELFRVVKRGGRVAVAVLGSAERFRLREILMSAIETADPGFRRTRRPGLELQDPEQLADEMRRARFQNVTVHTVARVWSTPSPAWLWEHVKGMSPLITSMLERLTAQNLKKAGHVFVESLRNEFGDGPVRLEAVGLIGIGMK